MITFIESGNRIATENFETGEIYTITFTNGNYKSMCCVGIGADFVMFQDKLPNALFCLTMGTSETVSTIELGGGGSGTMNYNELENKPQINGIVLIGNKTASDLNLVSQNDLDNYVTDTELSTAISGKQDTLTTTQLTAVNSGITSSLVSQITTNQNNILKNKNALTNIINSSGKNNLKLLNDVGYSTTINNVTYTVNSDYTITANGTAQGQSRFDFAHYTARTGDILSGTTGGSATTYFIYIRGGSSDYCYNNGITIANGDIGVSRTYSIVIAGGVQVNNVIFKPMVCSSDLWNISSEYEPYAMTNAEITAKERTNANNISIEDITNKVSMKTGFTIDTSYSKLYKQGKHIFGNLVLKKSTGVYNSTGDIVATITDYPPILTVVNAIGLTNTVNQMQNIGWIYISSASETPAGSITIRDGVGSINNCAVIQIDYVTA